WHTRHLGRSALHGGAGVAMHVRSTVEQKNWRILPAVVDTGGRLGRSTVNRPGAQRRSSPGAPPWNGSGQ
ncbi:MAG: hypothetical protein ACXVB5_22575, partial [Isosphaeraceae bacterium]